jgi:uncharacterized integral membrane protein
LLFSNLRLHRWRLLLGSISGGAVQHSLRSGRAASAQALLKGTNMNQTDEKPMKPKWFVIVEIALSFVLLYVLLMVFIVLANALKLLGIPPMWAMLLALVIFLAVIHGIILPNWKTKK